MLKESERYNFVLKAWSFGICLVTVLERGEVALHCNFWLDILCWCGIAKDMSSFKLGKPSIEKTRYNLEIFRIALPLPPSLCFSFLLDYKVFKFKFNLFRDSWQEIAR